MFPNLLTSLYLLVLLAPLGGAMGIGLGLCAWVACQARRRGYSFFVWLLACIVSLNPLLILVVLVMLPDARKKALRVNEMKALEAKFAARTPVEAPRRVGAVPAGSLGDQST